MAMKTEILEALKPDEQLNLMLTDECHYDRLTPINNLKKAATSYVELACYIKGYEERLKTKKKVPYSVLEALAFRNQVKVSVVDILKSFADENRCDSTVFFRSPFSHRHEEQTIVHYSKDFILCAGVCKNDNCKKKNRF